MKHVLIGGAAFIGLALVASSALASDNLTATGQVPHTCHVSDWIRDSSTIGSFNPITGSIGTLTFAESELIDTASVRSKIATGGTVDGGLAIYAPMYCNINFNVSFASSVGAFRRVGAAPSIPSSFAQAWPYQSGFAIGPDTDTALSPTTAPSTGSPTTQTITNRRFGSANYVGIQFALQPISGGGPSSQPRMVAGTYSETFTLTLTPN